MDHAVEERSEAIRSVAQLRRAHVRLLAFFRGEEEAAGLTAMRASVLRQAAQRLGAWIEDGDERDTAQGILDYWTAAVAGLPDQPAPELAFLDPFHAALPGMSAERAEAAIASTFAGQEDLVDTILLALLRTDRAGHLVEGPPVSRAELPEGDDRRDKIIGLLTEQGVISVQPGKTADEDRIEFDNRAVARLWPRVQRLFDRHRAMENTRDRLRATAQLWKQNGEAPGYLLGRDSLRDAANYLSADTRDPAAATLNAYIVASQNKARRDRGLLLGAIILGPTLALMIWWLAFSSGESTGRREGVKEYDNDLVVAAQLRPAAKPAPTRPSSETVVQPTLVPPRPTGGVGREGFLWIGNAERPLLRRYPGGQPVSPDDVVPDGVYRVKGPENITLRAGWPEKGISAPEIGIAPANSLIVVQSRPVINERPSGAQYWVKARVMPRAYIQHANLPAEQLARVVDSLRARGFDVPGTQIIPRYNARSEVRYFYSEDRATAGALVEVAAAALGEGNERAAEIRCRYMKYPGATPTFIEIWINPASLPLVATVPGEPCPPPAGG